MTENGPQEEEKKKKRRLVFENDPWSLMNCITHGISLMLISIYINY